MLFNSQQLTEPETAHIMRQIVDGLQYLHANNILHRDMKLPNLLVTADMRVKIADFGLATQLSRPDEPHMTMCGTPNYISPEVAMRTAHGQPADVWGLGIMMYTLLVGRPPFDTDGVASTLKRVCQAELPLPLHMSAEARDLLDRLLQKDQQRRIRLADVLCHPFMVKHLATATKAASPLAATAHYDSGVMTMSTTPSTISSGAATAAAALGSRFPQPIVEECALMDYDLPAPRQAVESGYAESPTYGSSANLNPFLPAVAKGADRSVFGTLESRHHSVYGNAGNAHAFATPAKHQQENIQPNHQQQQPLQPAAGSAIDVAQLNAERLLPTRYETKKAILSIDADGRVLVELQRTCKTGRSSRSTEICRISRDGARIEIYQPDPGRQPAEPADPNRVEHFAYPHVPARHWKKYTYAARFVQLVRAKTPKVTYYSLLAKCQLMETLADFEMCFYAGDERFTRTPADGVRFTSARGAVTEELDFGVRLDGPSAAQRDHLQHCWQHCVQLERALREMQCDGEVFPTTVGRRPVTVPQVIGPKATGERCASVSSPRMMPNVSEVIIKRSFLYRILTMSHHQHIPDAILCHVHQQLGQHIHKRQPKQPTPPPPSQQTQPVCSDHHAQRSHPHTGHWHRHQIGAGRAGGPVQRRHPADRAAQRAGRRLRVPPLGQRCNVGADAIHDLR